MSKKRNMKAVFWIGAIPPIKPLLSALTGPRREVFRETFASPESVFHTSVSLLTAKHIPTPHLHVDVSLGI